MLHLLIVVLTLLALLSLAEALYSLIEGNAGARRIVEAARSGPGAFAPPATLIVPCRGVDPGLEANLRAYCELDYADLQLIFVTGDPTDPAVRVVERVRSAYPRINSLLLFSGMARQRGQKVHNLLCALGQVRTRDRVVAFGDSDIRPPVRWLRDLIAGLSDSDVGLSTGFRWYVPIRGNFASVLRSVWNAGIAGLLLRRDAPFAWGGAMAIRKAILDSLPLLDYWDGALSDDYALSRAMENRGLAIRFQPRCLSVSYEDCTLRELWTWSFRQLAITRVYHPSLWRLGLVSEVVNNVAWWGGLAGVLWALALGGVPAGWIVGLGVTLGAIYFLRCLKAWRRLCAVAAIFPRDAEALWARRWAYTLWGPLTSLITLTGLVRAMFSSMIEWRGIRYRMVSPTKTVVIGSREPGGASRQP